NNYHCELISSAATQIHLGLSSVREPVGQWLHDIQFQIVHPYQTSTPQTILSKGHLSMVFIQPRRHHFSIRGNDDRIKTRGVFLKCLLNTMDPDFEVLIKPF